MSRGIKDIQKKLDAVAYNKQFSLKLDTEPIRKRRVETYSRVNSGDIIGKDDDVEKIVHMLFDTNVQENVSFITIVGIGGLGKTALAQLLYNDPRVTSAFQLRLWTCVSDQDQKELQVKDILCKILDRNLQDSTLDQVQVSVQNQVADKKYLLVLDDVWTENRKQWCDLAKYFIGSGQRGSRIVVTTRSLKTATIIDGQKHELQGLYEENSQFLFQRTAFGSIDESNPPDQELVKFGQEMVNRCAGVPLAITVMGSLLYGQEKGKWQSVQKIGLANIREKDNGIMPILKLSYHHLETPLKSCFTYCALFPQDFRMEKEKMISLWMAQSYIVPFDEGQSIEDASEEYISILCKRFFFQDIQKDQYGKIVSFKIHDLMHEMAQRVAGKEFFATYTISDNPDKKVRHLAVSGGERGNYSMSKSKSKSKSHIHSYLRIRSYLHIHPYIKIDLPLISVIKDGRHLRVLDLSNVQTNNLPSSICGLIHLRYIDLSRNYDFTILPNSLTKLYNLQTLILDHCRSLKEIPKDLSKLINLRVLEISFCSELTYMPRGMSKLTCLHRLSDFIVGGRQENCSSWKQWFDGIEDVKALDNLKGGLDIDIRWRKNATDFVKEHKSRKGLYLMGKEHVNSIKITFRDMEDCERVDFIQEEARAVMEDLQPHPNLKALDVKGYHGVRMASWITLLPNLVDLSLQDCAGLEYLSCLGNLRHLKDLKLFGLPKLEYIEEENQRKNCKK